MYIIGKLEKHNQLLRYLQQIVLYDNLLLS